MSGLYYILHLINQSGPTPKKKKKLTDPEGNQ